jgi:hypothetical protein
MKISFIGGSRFTHTGFNHIIAGVMVTFQVLFYIHSGNPTYVSNRAKRFKNNGGLWAGLKKTAAKCEENSYSGLFVYPSFSHWPGCRLVRSRPKKGMFVKK